MKEAPEMPVELILAIPPTIDLCFKYGKEIKALCSALRHADAEISERTLRLENSWLRFSHQLNFLRRVETLMDDEHREIHAQTLHVLQEKLKAVAAILGGLRKYRISETGQVVDTEFSTRKAKYVFTKDRLNKAIEDLQLWQQTADQSWFLLMKIADPKIDDALAEPSLTEDDPGTAVAVPSALSIRSGLSGVEKNAATNRGLTFIAEKLKEMTVSPVPFSLASIARRCLSNGDVSTYVLNTINVHPFAKYETIKRDTRDLVRKLQHSDPHTFGLLTCKGFAIPSKVPPFVPGSPEPQVTFTMVLRPPPNSENPRSLRDLLLNTPGPKSLSVKFDMARELVKSVGYVHTFGFVHKNIRPESVLTFDTSGTQSVFLVGFENFRKEEGRTQRLGDDALDKNLYRHPSRQGSSPGEDYVMQHDIYSLGVCLLEIGLWKSLVVFNTDDCSLHPDLLGIHPSSTPPQTAHFLQSSGKEKLLHLTRNRLPRHMGTKYAEIVETCLTCLDSENLDFGEVQEFQDEDGIQVGVRYIEKVLYRVNGILV